MRSAVEGISWTDTSKDFRPSMSAWRSCPNWSCSSREDAAPLLLLDGYQTCQQPLLLLSALWRAQISARKTSLVWVNAAVRSCTRCSNALWAQ